jgi:hypothetical protein
MDGTQEILARATELATTSSKALPPVGGGSPTPGAADADDTSSRRGEDLMLRLNDLKDMVEWLRPEMAKLGDTREGSKCRETRHSTDEPDRGQAVNPWQ